MGRPERTVNADWGPVAKFACDLRALREAAGSPTYRNLAAKANYSATVLSRAASGRELPSLPVVNAYVRACGGDPDSWRIRWLEMSGQQSPPDVDDRGSGQVGDPDEAGQATTPALPRAGVFGRYRIPVAGLSVLLAAATASVMAFGVPGSVATGGRDRVSTGPAQQAAPAVAVHAVLSDGNDPAASGCGRDAVTVTYAILRLGKPVTITRRRRPAGTVAGQVELRYSAHCHAAWSRAIPSPALDGISPGWVTVSIARPADGTYETFRAAPITAAYGDLLLAGRGCLTASAEFQFRGGGTAYAATPCWGPR